MGRKKKPIPDDPEQYARFKETAKELLGEDAEEKFKEAVKRILTVKRGKAELAEKQKM